MFFNESCKMKLFLQIIVTILLLTYINIVDAQGDTCFWNLSGITQLVGPDLIVSVNDSSFCSVIPSFFVHVSLPSYVWSVAGIILMSKNGEELLVSFSPDIGCPLCVGCKCIDRYSKPLPIALPSATEPISSAAMVTTRMIQSEDIYDTVSVVIATNTGLLEVSFIDIRLHRFDPQKPDFKINSIRSISLTEKVDGQKINGIASMNDTGAIIVYGAKGLLRVIKYSETINENIYDINPTENLTCSGDEYIGSEDGTIYQIGNNQPVAETGEHLRSISASGAAAERGRFLEHTGDEWNIFSAESLSVQYCSFINTTKGREALIIDDKYHLHQQFLYNTPTKLSVDTLSGLIQNINGTPFIYKGTDPLSVTFTLIDNEGNINWPKVELRSKDTSYQIGCNRPLFGKIIRMTFANDIISKIETTQYFVCPDPPDCFISSGPPCTTTVSWNILDTIFITTENDKLIIINGTTISADRSGRMHNTASVPYIIVDNIITDIRKGNRPISDNANFNFSIYTIEGKEVPLNNLNRVLIPGTYILRINYYKSQLTRRLSIIR